MLNERGHITVEVLGLELAHVDSFANPVSAPRRVELPFAELHQLVVRVEWTDKDFGL